MTEVSMRNDSSRGSAISFTGPQGAGMDFDGSEGWEGSQKGGYVVHVVSGQEFEVG